MIRRGPGFLRAVGEGLLGGRMRQRPVVAALHGALVLGLLVLAAGSLAAQLGERLLRPAGLGGVGPLGQGLVEGAGLLVLSASAGLLLRRLAHPTLPRRPGGTALLGAILVLAASGFLLEGLRIAQQGPHPRDELAFVGRALAAGMGPLAGPGPLGAWRGLWWGHAALALLTLALLPATRLRHALAAPLHLARGGRRPARALPTPFRLDELLAAGTYDLRLGLAGPDDLAPRRAELLACAACGRCEDLCPVHRVGGPLSPRRLVQVLAERLPGSGGAADAPPAPPAEAPLGAAAELAWACLQCGGCAEACPAGLHPAELAVELRRAEVLAGRLPPGPARTLSQLALRGNPYGGTRAAREDAVAALGLPTLAEAPGAGLVYWPGCAAAYDARIQKVARATATLLKRAGVEVAVVDGAACCGEPARRLGEEGRFQELALGNLQRLAGKRVLTHCPHCLETLGGAYRDLGGDLDVVHHADLLAELSAEGRLEGRLPDRIAVHDACALARREDPTDAARRLLRSLGAEPVELADRGRRTACCGGGGTWLQEGSTPLPAAARRAQAEASGAERLAVGCPFCLKMLGEAEGSLPVQDLAELLLEGLGPPEPTTLEGPRP